MISVSEKYSHVTGVDTHAAQHVFTVIDSVTGKVVDTASFPTTPAGLKRSVSWTIRHSPTPPLVVIEGIGSYGAQLAAVMARAGLDVAEPDPIPAVVKRGKGKNDQMDSRRIAASVLATPVDHLRRPRADAGIRDALSVLATARDTMNQERTRAINQVTALIRIHGLGMDARTSLTHDQYWDIAHWKTHDEPLADAAARNEATRLARRVLDLGHDLDDNKKHILRIIVASPYAILLDEKGIGPVSAATIIIAWGTHGRIHSEAAFAALAGANPIPVSSGTTSRHRLNRGGDRRLNRALTVIINSRMTHHDPTRQYVADHLAKGRTQRDIKRILKRYLARHLYKILDTIVVD